MACYKLLRFNLLNIKIESNGSFTMEYRFTKADRLACLLATPPDRDHTKPGQTTTSDTVYLSESPGD